MDAQIWALISTIVVLSVATYFLGPILLGALLRSLNEQTKDPDSDVQFCIAPKDNQVATIMLSDQFESFYLHSNDYTFYRDLSDEEREIADEWLNKRGIELSGDALQYQIFESERENETPRMSNIQKWILDKYGVYVFQNIRFAKKLHTYPFHHHKLEIDNKEDGKGYRIDSHEDEHSPWVYTKRFTLAIPVNDAEDYYGVKTSIRATFKLRCRNPYIALFIADNYMQQIYAAVTNAIVYFVRERNLIIAALDGDSLGELKDEVRKQKDQLKAHFSRYLTNLTWRDPGDASETKDQATRGGKNKATKAILGLLAQTGTEVIDADLTDVKIAPSQEEQIRPALNKVLEEALNRRASVDQMEAAKNLAKGEAELMQRIKEHGESGQVYYMWKKLAESDVTVLTTEGGMRLNVDAETGKNKPSEPPQNEGGEQ